MGDVHARLRAVILCGGRSVRFGSDKARALVDGVPQIKRIANIIRTCGFEPTAQADVAGKYDDLGMATLADAIPGLGPLGGITTALAEFCGEDVLVFTCDMPLISAALIAPLIEIYQTCAGSVFYKTADQVQPFPGIYACDSLPIMRTQLNQGRRAMKECIALLPHVHLTCKEEEQELININTQKQYEKTVS